MKKLTLTHYTLKPEPISTMLASSYCPEMEQRIVVMDNQECIFLKVNKICYIEANGAYSVLYLQDGKNLVVSKNMKVFSQKLSEKMFFRIHKSFIVNLYYVSKYVKSDGGYVIMENGKAIPVSPNKRDVIMELVTHLSL